MPKSKEKGFYCDVCNLPYDSQSQWEEHQWSMLHHTNLGKKELVVNHHCALCAVTCSSLVEYSIHLIKPTHRDAQYNRIQELRNLNTPQRRHQQDFSRDSFDGAWNAAPSSDSDSQFDRHPRWTFDRLGHNQTGNQRYHPYHQPRDGNFPSKFTWCRYDAVQENRMANKRRSNTSGHRPSSRQNRRPKDTRYRNTQQPRLNRSEFDVYRSSLNRSGNLQKQPSSESSGQRSREHGSLGSLHSNFGIKPLDSSTRHHSHLTQKSSSSRDSPRDTPPVSRPAKSSKSAPTVRERKPDDKADKTSKSKNGMGHKTSSVSLKPTRREESRSVSTEKVAIPTVSAKEQEKDNLTKSPTVSAKEQEKDNLTKSASTAPSLPEPVELENVGAEHALTVAEKSLDSSSPVLLHLHGSEVTWTGSKTVAPRVALTNTSAAPKKSQIQEKNAADEISVSSTPIQSAPQILVTTVNTTSVQSDVAESNTRSILVCTTSNLPSIQENSLLPEVIQKDIRKLARNRLSKPNVKSSRVVSYPTTRSELAISDLKGVLLDLFERPAPLHRKTLIESQLKELFINAGKTSDRFKRFGIHFESSQPKRDTMIEMLEKLTEEDLEVLYRNESQDIIHEILSLFQTPDDQSSKAAKTGGATAPEFSSSKNEAEELAKTRSTEKTGPEMGGSESSNSDIEIIESDALSEILLSSDDDLEEGSVPPLSSGQVSLSEDSSCKAPSLEAGPSQSSQPVEGICSVRSQQTTEGPRIVPEHGSDSPLALNKEQMSTSSPLEQDSVSLHPPSLPKIRGLLPKGKKVPDSSYENSALPEPSTTKSSIRGKVFKLSMAETKVAQEIRDMKKEQKRIKSLIKEETKKLLELQRRLKKKKQKMKVLRKDRRNLTSEHLRKSVSGKEFGVSSDASASSAVLQVGPLKFSLSSGHTSSSSTTSSSTDSKSDNPPNHLVSQTEFAAGRRMMASNTSIIARPLPAYTVNVSNPAFIIQQPTLASGTVIIPSNVRSVTEASPKPPASQKPGVEVPHQTSEEPRPTVLTPQERSTVSQSTTKVVQRSAIMAKNTNVAPVTTTTTGQPSIEASLSKDSTLATKPVISTKSPTVLQGMQLPMLYTVVSPNTNFVAKRTLPRLLPKGSSSSTCYLLPAAPSAGQMISPMGQQVTVSAPVVNPNNATLLQQPSISPRNSISTPVDTLHEVSAAPTPPAVTASSIKDTSVGEQAARSTKTLTPGCIASDINPCTSLSISSANSVICQGQTATITTQSLLQASSFGDKSLQIVATGFTLDGTTQPRLNVRLPMSHPQPTQFVSLSSLRGAGCSLLPDGNTLSSNTGHIPIVSQFGIPPSAMGISIQKVSDEDLEKIAIVSDGPLGSDLDDSPSAAPTHPSGPRIDDSRNAKKSGDPQEKARACEKSKSGCEMAVHKAKKKKKKKEKKEDTLKYGPSLKGCERSFERRRECQDGTQNEKSEKASEQVEEKPADGGPSTEDRANVVTSLGQPFTLELLPPMRILPLQTSGQDKSLAGNIEVGDLHSGFPASDTHPPTSGRSETTSDVQGCSTSKSRLGEVENPRKSAEGMLSNESTGILPNDAAIDMQSTDDVNGVSGKPAEATWQVGWDKEVTQECGQSATSGAAPYPVGILRVAVDTPCGTSQTSPDNPLQLTDIPGCHGDVVIKKESPDVEDRSIPGDRSIPESNPAGRTTVPEETPGSMPGFESGAVPLSLHISSTEPSPLEAGGSSTSNQVLGSSQTQDITPNMGDPESPHSYRNPSSPAVIPRSIEIDSGVFVIKKELEQSELVSSQQTDAPSTGPDDIQGFAGQDGSKSHDDERPCPETRDSTNTDIHSGTTEFGHGVSQPNASLPGEAEFSTDVAHDEHEQITLKTEPQGDVNSRTFAPSTDTDGILGVVSHQEGDNPPDADERPCPESRNVTFSMSERGHGPADPSPLEGAGSLTDSSQECERKSIKPEPQVENSSTGQCLNPDSNDADNAWISQRSEGPYAGTDDSNGYPEDENATNEQTKVQYSDSGTGPPNDVINGSSSSRIQESATSSPCDVTDGLSFSGFKASSTGPLNDVMNGLSSSRLKESATGPLNDVISGLTFSRLKKSATGPLSDVINGLSSSRIQSATGLLSDVMNGSTSSRLKESATGPLNDVINGLSFCGLTQTATGPLNDVINGLISSRLKESATRPLSGVMNGSSSSGMKECATGPLKDVINELPSPVEAHSTVSGEDVNSKQGEHKSTGIEGSTSSCVQQVQEDNAGCEKTSDVGSIEHSMGSQERQTSLDTSIVPNLHSQAQTTDKYAGICKPVVVRLNDIGCKLTEDVLRSSILDAHGPMTERLRSKDGPIILNHHRPEEGKQSTNAPLENLDAASTKLEAEEKVKTVAGEKVKTVEKVKCLTEEASDSMKSKNDVGHAILKKPSQTKKKRNNTRQCSMNKRMAKRQKLRELIELGLSPASVEIFKRGKGADDVQKKVLQDEIDRLTMLKNITPVAESDDEVKTKKLPKLKPKKIDKQELRKIREKIKLARQQNPSWYVTEKRAQGVKAKKRPLQKNSLEGSNICKKRNPGLMGENVTAPGNLETPALDKPSYRIQDTVMADGDGPTLSSSVEKETVESNETQEEMADLPLPHGDEESPSLEERSCGSVPSSQLQEEAGDSNLMNERGRYPGEYKNFFKKYPQEYKNLFKKLKDHFLCCQYIKSRELGMSPQFLAIVLKGPRATKAQMRMFNREKRRLQRRNKSKKSGVSSSESHSKVQVEDKVSPEQKESALPANGPFGSSSQMVGHGGIGHRRPLPERDTASSLDGKNAVHPWSAQENPPTLKAKEGDSTSVTLEDNPDGRKFTRLDAGDLGKAIFDLTAVRGKLYGYSKDGFVRCYNKDNLSCEKVFAGHQKKITGMWIQSGKALPPGQPLYLFTCSEDRYLMWHTFQYNNAKTHYKVFDHPITCMAGSRSGLFLALSTGHIECFQLPEFQSYSYFQCQADVRCICPAYLPTLVLVTASSDGVMNVYDRKDGTFCGCLEGHLSAVLSMKEAGGYVYSGDSDGMLIQHKLKAMRFVSSFTHEGAVTCIKFHRQYLLTSSLDNHIRIFDKGKVMQLLRTISVQDVLSFSPCRDEIFYGKTDGTLGRLRKPLILQKEFQKTSTP